MSRLLNANFARLFKGKLFWLCAATSVALGLFEIIQYAIKVKGIELETGEEYPLNPESALMNLLYFAGWFGMFIITAIFVGIFVGAEHGGALRNNIISGHKRVSVYMANLLTCISGVLIFQLLYVAAVLVTGIILGGEFLLSFETIAVYQLLNFLSLIALCALFTAITMLIPQKLAGAIAALVLVIVLYFVDTSVEVALARLPTEDYVTDWDTGEIYTIEKTDEERLQVNILSFIHKINPLGQSAIVRSSYTYTYDYTRYKLLDNDFKKPIPPVPTDILPYSLGVIAVSTAVGILVFRKKDLR